MTRWVRWLPIGLFVILAIFLWRGLSGDPHTLPSARLGKSVPAFELAALSDTTPGFSSQALRGGYTLLNVWASWCEACTEEQSFLMQLSQQGVRIYGLNYQDQADAASLWLRTWGNPYQAVGSDPSGRVAMELGVYGTPETFLIDSNGVIQFRYAGILNPTVWQHAFLPRIRSLSAVPALRDAPDKPSSPSALKTGVHGSLREVS